jgi:hypothetical protein
LASKPNIEDGMDKSKPIEVTVEIAEGQPTHYIIRASQLDEIGKLLRGEPRSSFISSVFLPFIIAFITACVVPYVTWLASLNLQHATERAERGVEIYEKAAAAIDQRWTVTNGFFSTLIHRVRQQSSSSPNGPSSGLDKAAADLQNTRFAEYYDQLKSWSTNYEGLLASIDYGLDQPVFTQIAPQGIENKVTNKKNQTIDCKQGISLSDQLQNAGYFRYSLKAQFAVIGLCLHQADLRFGRPDAIVGNPLSESDVDHINAILDNIYTMSNTFRCYADWRLRYFYQEKHDATLTISHILKLFDIFNLFGPKVSKYDTTKDDGCLETEPPRPPGG